MAENNLHKWVTLAQAQEILGIKRTKMFQLRKNHELKYAVDGHKVYVLRISIDEYLDRHMVVTDFTQLKKGGQHE
ncbi:MAG: helix-turn-helix domain-containing protein [Saprospiraceae bacterium]|nr:helix-turn-helix domain-containing protein [Candidatus Defluviibacterium haderslevense]